MPKTPNETWAEFERKKQTEPSLPDAPPIAECVTCSNEIYEGDEIYRSNLNGDLYCNRDCFRSDVRAHIYHFVALLEESGYTGETIAVKD